MRAMLCRAFGGPENLELAETEAPSAGPGEVLIAVAAAGVNYADTLMLAGEYQEKPPFPFSPGLEIAGRVEAVGEGVDRIAPGDRVMAVTDHGGFAELAVAREADVYPLPITMDYETAAGFPIIYGTGHAALVWRGALEPGETLLVHAAAGGVGLAAVEIGKALGAKVIATAGGPDKLAVATAHGADAAIDYRTEDIRERVKALTEGRGADVVFDPVGGDVFDASLRATAWSGRLLIIGFAAGRVPQIPANILMVKNLSAIGLYWGSYRKHQPQRLAVAFEELFAWYEAGRLNPLVSEAYELARAPEALRDLRERRSTGKLVLITGQG